VRIENGLEIKTVLIICALQNCKVCIVHNKIVNTSELGWGKGAVQLCHPGGKLCGDVLIANLCEVAIREVDVLYMAIRTPLDKRHFGRERMDVVEVNIADGVTQIIFRNADRDGRSVVAVNGNVGKADIFNMGRFKTFVAHTGIGRIAGKKHTQAVERLGDIQIGECTVAYDTVIDPAYTDSTSMTG